MAKTSFKRQANSVKEKPRKITVTYKQGMFIQCQAKMVLFGGAAGGGKSFAQLIDAMYCADNYPGIRQLILRESFPELRRSLISKSNILFPLDRFQWNENDSTWYHINGSTIEFGYLDSDDRVKIYKSAEYDIIRFDEATEFSEFRLSYMQSRIRGTNAFPHQIKMSSNPDGPGHKYLKKAFKVGVNEPGVTFKEYVGKDKDGIEKYESRCYIPALVYENEFLMKEDPDYITNLLKLPEKERKALLEGSWDINDDNAFPEFDYNTHACKPFKIPAHWKRWRSVDNGYDDPFAWYWFTVSEQGKVYIYREFTREKGDKATMINYKTQAEKVVEKSMYVDDIGQEHEEKYTFTVAGHDAFATHVRDEQGKTLIDHYNDGGLFGFIQGITNRRFRKATMHEYLTPYMDENIGKMTAKLQIFDTCKVIIEKLPEMLKDPDDHEKVLDVDDHSYDSVGMGICAYHAGKSRGLSPEKSDLEKYHDKLWRNAKRKNRHR
jgi:PBSX family phage terminase large subunit